MAAKRNSPGEGGIFYNFQVEGAAPRRQSSDKEKSAAKNDDKPLKTTHACAECKRRKIRCDGREPCHQCLFNRVPKRCLYDKRRPRVITSRRTVEGLSQSLEECRSVLNRLYPNRDVGTLLHLTRQELLELLVKPPPDDRTSLLSPPPITSPSDGCEQSPRPEAEFNMTNLEQIPTGDVEWDEECRDKDPIPVEADDINALSLAMDKRASYLGASSVKAALTVMLILQPRLKDCLKPTLSPVEMRRQSSLARRQSSTSKAEAAEPCLWKTQNFIDAYFKRVHVFAPMLDEAAFRQEFQEGTRKDSPWLALLNSVLAMGSIAAGKSMETSHAIYYHKAMEHLGIEAFASSRIETVQALAIMGGWYLHYVNQPNLAHALLGTAMRMACALGLHRESPSRDQSATDVRAAEIRRGTWWSLFCLDTWGTTTMGRPSFGRWGPAINVRPPELGMNQAADSSGHAGVLPLIENIKFCKIATHIQDVLASTPLPGSSDRRDLDQQLRTWYENLPWLLQTTAPCAEPLYIVRCVMKWRYQNLRMLLHRHVLLAMATQAKIDHSPENTAAVETCWAVATETIEDISKEWTRTQMLGWNAAWFLYQAVMIPLVSLFWQKENPRATEWQKSIELAIELLDKMEDWSVTAHRSRDVIQQIYNFILGRNNNPAQEGADGDNGTGENVFGMSPFRFDIEDIMTLQGQDWGWDLDSMFWEEPVGASQNGYELYQTNLEEIFSSNYTTDFQNMPTYP